MTLSRRRFLTISAAFAAAPRGAVANTWEGRAFGADVSITIRGAHAPAQAALRDARDVIRQIEALFNLYDPTSALSRLNRTGQLQKSDPRFLELMEAATFAHKVTDGLFDPTVQPLWQAAASGADTMAAAQTVGWDRVHYDQERITLGNGQALTFNGIAQGYATEIISEALAQHGLSNTLINIGEYRGSGGPWRIGISDPIFGHLGSRTLTNGAIATSSPVATPLGDTGHILHATARAKWSTVSVEAASATLADSLSTAIVLASRDQIEDIKQRAEITRVTLVDMNGDLTTL